MGAATFWPVTVGIPFPCYIKVHRPRRSVVLLMKVVWVAMALVSVLAAIGAFRGMIVGWSDTHLFS